MTPEERRSAMAPPSPLTLKQLYQTTFNHPAIDNHAHPLLSSNRRSRIPFEGVISEAQGDALDDAIHTLACYHATEQLNELFEIPPAFVNHRRSCTWDDVKRWRDTLDYSDLCRTCFEPTQIECILMDDGLNGVDELAEPYQWHDTFTRSETKRILRIEKFAEDILTQLFKSGSFREHSPLLPVFDDIFRRDLDLQISLPNVVAFKSIVCYRTGLQISTKPLNVQEVSDVELELSRLYTVFQSQQAIRLQYKPFNDHIVRIALEMAAKHDKPIQFHTGLGDNDINLTTASPVHLQPLIKEFPSTKFVLLHASYPFTREAGYLASVYKNVFLDFGLVFPLVSGDGQRANIRQVLELCPTNKILFSTDGHWWPESYYLSTIQTREALWEVLSKLVEKCELTEEQAITIVENALFHNANKLYHLHLVVSVVVS